jgi:hypothetical protein
VPYTKVIPREWESLAAGPQGSRPGNLILLDQDNPFGKFGCECPNCGDRPPGYVLAWKVAAGTGRGISEKWFGSLRVYGNLITAPCPVCAGDARQGWLLDNCGLVGKVMADGREAPDVRFSDFLPRDGAEHARQLAAVILEDMTGKRNVRSLTLCGEFGTGKTLLLCAIVNAARLAGIFARYTTAESMLQDLRDTFNRETRRRITEDVIREYVNVPVLALDEMPRVNFDSPWVRAQWFEILDSRLGRAVLTICASNIPLGAMRDDPLSAIASRLGSGLVADIASGDARPMIGAALSKEYS